MLVGLTKYGRREWLLATIIIAAGIWASIYLAMPNWYWSLVTVVPLAAVWLFVMYFFRDPDRLPPGPGGLFVSPADGRVSDITLIGIDSPLGEPGVKIGVFMSVFDVHVNRAPADASVEYIQHTPGAFMDVRDPLAFERNESATVFLAYHVGGKEYPIVIRQVAGLIARRIVTDLVIDQPIRRGQRIGMIKFGSRVELMVPQALMPKVQVKIGDRVRAGESVLVSTGDGEANAPEQP